MITQKEIEAMRAIVAFGKEYLRQNSFVKITTIQKNYTLCGDIHSTEKKEVLLRVSDISYIKETDKDEVCIYLNNDKRFFISKKEYKEKLANLIIF